MSPIKISYASLSPKFVYCAGCLFVTILPWLIFFVMYSFDQDTEPGNFIGSSIASSIGVLLFYLCMKFFPTTYDIGYDENFVYILRKSKGEKFPLESVEKIKTTFWGFRTFFTVNDLLILEINYKGQIIKRGFLSQPNSYFNTSIEQIPLIKEFKEAVIRKKEEKGSDAY